MSRTVPSLTTQNPGNLVSSTLWNTGPKAMGDFYTAPPMFRGRQLASQTFTSGVWDRVHLDVTDVDTDSGHSNTVNNARYTAQTGGWYWVLGFMAWGTGGGGGDMYCALYINGTIMLGTGQVLQRTGGAGGFASLSSSSLVFLHAGDYVETWARQDTGANLTSWNGTSDLEPCMNLVWAHS